MLERLRQVCSRGIKVLHGGRVARSGRRTNRWVEEESLGRNSGKRQLCDERPWSLIVSKGYSGDAVGVADKELVKLPSCKGREENNDIDSNGKKRVRDVHLEAVEKVAVGHGRVVVVDSRDGSQQVSRHRDGHDLAQRSHASCEWSDAIVRCKQIGVGQVGDGGQSGDVND